MKKDCNKEKEMRLKLLSDRYKEVFKIQPELEQLVLKLLSIGGDVVCLNGYEEDANNIITRGQEFSSKKIKMMKGRPSSCHSNSSELWYVNQSLTSLVTGYALSCDEDGLKVWRCHSWVIRNDSNQVVETTVKRKKYYGFKLNEAEALEFWRSNL